MGEGARQPRVWEDVSTALERARATQRGQKFNLKAGKGKKKGKNRQRTRKDISLKIPE